MSKNARVLRLLLIALLFIWLIFSLFPIVWTILTSIKPPSEAASLPPTLFFKPSLSNYNTVLFGGKGGFYSTTQEGFWDNALHSIIISFASTILCLILGTMSAFYISRSGGKEKLAFWILSIKMLPAVAVILPYYLMMAYIGLVDSLISLILINAIFNLPMTIWLLTSYLNGVPKTYDEMARIDGLNQWEIFWKVILPLSKPAIISSALLSFIFSWNEFLFAVVLSGVKSKTLPVLATGFITERGIIWGQLTATAIIITVPIFFLALFSQRYFVNGMSMGLKSK